MLQDSAGNRLFRRVDIRIIFPDAILPDEHIRQRAEARKGFSDTNIDTLLMQIADDLDTKFPFWDFKSVELKPEGRTAKYVFTFAGYRSTKIYPNEESTTLEPGMVGDSTPTEVGNASAIPLSQE